MTWKSFLACLLIITCQSSHALPDQNRDIQQLQKALEREHRAIVALEQQRQYQSERLAALQQVLISQMEAAVKLGKQTTKTRLLNYHGYLGRSRLTLIRDIQQAQTERNQILQKRKHHEASLKEILTEEMKKTPLLPTAFIPTPVGTPIHVIASGKVIFADWLRGFGFMVIVSHGNGYMSLYGRNNQLYTKTGDKVRTGQTIATAGHAGRDAPERYFELRHNGIPVDPTHYPQA